MLSLKSHFRYAVRNCLFFIIIIIVSITETSHAGREVLGLQQESDHGAAAAAAAATHFNFFRAALRGRQRVLSCARDANICSDREKNPWGGGTCCFQQFCKDTLRDPNNCGACGQTCAYGLVCCGGKCVDIQNDPQNCGSCFEKCPGQNRCSFAMCDYGG